MLIYIIRHGEAHNDSHTGLDRDRKLTELGHQQARAAGAYLVGLGHESLLVIASSYIRAQETGSRVCGELDLALHTDDRLGADRGLTEMVAVAQKYADQEAIAIVSHMPTVGMFESTLIDGVAGRPGGLWTGQVVAVRVDRENLIGTGEVVDRYRLES